MVNIRMSSNIDLRSTSKTQRDEVGHILDIDPFIFKIYERIFIFD